MAKNVYNKLTQTDPPKKEVNENQQKVIVPPTSTSASTQNTSMANDMPNSKLNKVLAPSAVQQTVQNVQEEQQRKQDTYDKFNKAVTPTTVQEALKTAQAAYGKPKEEPAEADDWRNAVNSYIDIIAKNKARDEEEKKKHKKRQVINAIGDGLSALANLYFTTKGAPNVEQSSSLKANEDWFQKMRDQRLKDGDRTLNQKMAVDKMAELYRQAREQEKYRRDNLEATRARAEENRRQNNFRNTIAFADLQRKNKEAEDRAAQNKRANKLKEQDQAIQRQRNAILGNRKNSEGTSKIKTGTFSGNDGKVYEYNQRDLTRGRIRDFYNQIPDSLRKAFENENFNETIGKSMKDELKWQLIQDYILQDPMYSEKIIGTLTGNSASNSTPNNGKKKGYSRGDSSNNNNNKGSGY